MECANDKDLVQRLESTVIHWTRQIKAVVNSQEGGQGQEVSLLSAALRHVTHTRLPLTPQTASVPQHCGCSRCRDANHAATRRLARMVMMMVGKFLRVLL